MTPRRLDPAQYPELLEYVIGLTDICKTRSGSDQEVGRGGFDVDRLTVLLEANRPGWVAFNGKNSASGAFGHPVDYGRQDESCAGNTALVMPTTTGAAPRNWDISRWRELAQLV